LKCFIESSEKKRGILRRVSGSSHLGFFPHFPLRGLNIDDRGDHHGQNQYGRDDEKSDLHPSQPPLMCVHFGFVVIF
jgi:hypothetical protein